MLDQTGTQKLQQVTLLVLKLFTPLLLKKCLHFGNHCGLIPLSNSYNLCRTDLDARF